MSTTALCAVYKTKAVAIKEYRNSWGSGPICWDVVAGRIGIDRNAWLFGGEPAQKLWAAALDESIPLALRACHVLTFDRALLLRKHITEMANLVGQGARIIAKEAPHGSVINHWGAIADDLSEIARGTGALKLHGRALGIGICCTSVSDVWRGWRPSQGEPVDAMAYLRGEG